MATKPYVAGPIGGLVVVAVVIIAIVLVLAVAALFLVWLFGTTDDPQEQRYSGPKTLVQTVDPPKTNYYLHPKQKSYPIPTKQKSERRTIRGWLVD